MTSDAYRWACICGTGGRGEQSAQRHAKSCHRFGWPRTNPHVEEQR